MRSTALFVPVNSSSTLSVTLKFPSLYGELELSFMILQLLNKDKFIVWLLNSFLLSLTTKMCEPFFVRPIAELFQFPVWNTLSLNSFANLYKKPRAFLFLERDLTFIIQMGIKHIARTINTGMTISESILICLWM